MKKLHWTDSEFDRTYFLFLQQSTSWISYHSNPQVRNIPQLTFSYKASFKQLFFCGKQIVKAIFQLFFLLQLFSFVCTFSTFLFLVSALHAINHVIPLLPTRSLQYIEVESYLEERKKKGTICVSKITTSVRSAVFRRSHMPTIVLPAVYCPVDNTLFELSPEIRCSGVSSRCCCYGNHAAGSKPI